VTPFLGRAVFWEKNQNLQDPQSLNSYSYGNNNPIRFSDPTGRCAWDLCIGEAAITISAAEAIWAAVFGTAVIGTAVVARNSDQLRQMPFEAGKRFPQLSNGNPDPFGDFPEFNPKAPKWIKGAIVGGIIAGAIADIFGQSDEQDEAARDLKEKTDPSNKGPQWSNASGGTRIQSAPPSSMMSTPKIQSPTNYLTPQQYNYFQQQINDLQRQINNLQKGQTGQSTPKNKK
jgi:hypothetical protein